MCYIYRTTFSGAFQTGALTSIPKGSLIFDVFMNIALYFLFTALCLLLARPSPRLARALNSLVADNKRLVGLPSPLRRILRVRQLPRKQAVAVCFCGAAKTTSLGIPLVAAMWHRSNAQVVAYVQIPVLLYTIEQVFMAQILVYAFRRYLRRDEREATDGQDRQDEPGSASSGPEETK